MIGEEGRLKQIIFRNVRLLQVKTPYYMKKTSVGTSKIMILQWEK